MALDIFKYFDKYGIEKIKVVETFTIESSVAHGVQSFTRYTCYIYGKNISVKSQVYSCERGAFEDAFNEFINKDNT